MPDDPCLLDGSSIPGGIFSLIASIRLARLRSALPENFIADSIIACAGFIF